VNRVSEAVRRPAYGLPITDSTETDSRAATVSTIESFLAGIEQRAYRFALYELWDRDAALDAVQDSMWRLVERYATRPTGEWPALFFTILKNRTTDAKRWRVVQRMRGLFGGGVRHEKANEQVLLAVPASPDETPEARQTAAEQRRALQRALAELPARQRQTFLLRECEGLTTAETAQTLGCSEGTVKQHHFRALQALRAKLSKVWYEQTN
jgi:RNA polymerase sigma-70 factor (ECF subfamily)